MTSWEGASSHVFGNSFTGLTNRDGFYGFVLFSYRLVLFDFFLVTVDVVVVTDANHFRLVDTVVVYGRIVGEEDFILLERGVGNRDSGNKGTRIGMEREVEQLFRGCNLNYIALVDNADSVGDKADDGEVMRDEEVGGSSLLLELFKKVQNLRTMETSRADIGSSPRQAQAPLP